MKKGKNFFYRVNPESVLSELTSINHDEWLQFFLNFFHDLRNDDPCDTKTDIAATIIKESHNFRELRSKAGKASVKQKATYVEHMLKDVQPVAVAVAVIKEKEKNPCTSIDAHMENSFDKFWAAYPKKTAKGSAKKAWQKIKRPAETVQEIINALEWQKATKDWQKDGGQFIPYPASYLNARQWEDEPQNIKPEWQEVYN